MMIYSQRTHCQSLFKGSNVSGLYYGRIGYWFRLNWLWIGGYKAKRRANDQQLMLLIWSADNSICLIGRVIAKTLYCYSIRNMYIWGNEFHNG